MFWLFLILTIAAAALTWRWMQLGQRRLTTLGLLMTASILLLTIGLRLAPFGRGFFTALGVMGLVVTLVIGFRYDRYHGW